VTPRPRARRRAWWLLAAAPFLAQGAYFAWVILLPAETPARCDLFAVFGGVPERIERGIGLARGMDAAAFVISDSNAAEVRGYFRAYGLPGKAKILLEPRARHTVQNAEFVANLARSQRVQTLVIATSWYHVPRAALLMRLALAGSGIETRAIATETVPAKPWSDPYFWLEIPKFWGSLFQWCVGV
jgi:uncharacterized SAM-binding protein YcdF (DUF218 family)